MISLLWVVSIFIYQWHIILLFLNVNLWLSVLSFYLLLLLLFSHVWLFATQRTAACQASLSFMISWSLLKLMSSDAIQPSHPLSPSSPAFNLSQHQGLFQWVGSLHQVAKVLELQLQHLSFQWIFSTDFLWSDWFDPLSIQGILKSLLQHQSLKASILRCSASFVVHLSHLSMTTGLFTYNFLRSCRCNCICTFFFKPKQVNNLNDI